MLEVLTGNVLFFTSRFYCLSMSEPTVPIHDFTQDDPSSISFRFENMEYKNVYDPAQPHRHNYYEIFFFEKGGGHHMIDFQSIPIQSNTIHFISPGQVHQVNRAKDSMGYVVMFSREFFYLNSESKSILFDLPFFHNKTSRPTIEPDEATYQEIQQIVFQLKNEYQNQHQFKGDILRSYVNIILMKCTSLFDRSRLNNATSDSSVNQLVQEFRMKLEKHFTNVHQVNEYAEMLAVSTSHLNDATKKVLNKKSSELIQERLILEVKRLLMHSHLSNKEIAYFLNFSDPSYFSRFVKKRTGHSPNSLRKIIRDQFKT